MPDKTWLKILASVWGKKIGIPKHLSQATSLGAILCAGIGSGIFKDFSVIEKINPIDVNGVDLRRLQRLAIHPRPTDDEGFVTS